MTVNDAAFEQVAIEHTRWVENMPNAPAQVVEVRPGVTTAERGTLYAVLVRLGTNTTAVMIRRDPEGHVYVEE